jgi:hypothetical protein
MPLSQEEWREVIADVEDDLAQARENALAAAQLDLSAAPGLERMAAAAFLSERAYTACEAALERLAKVFGDEPTHSATYHKELLELYAHPWDNIRPALISPPTLAQLDPLRKYRHFLRHAYGVQLHPERVRENAELILRAVEGLMHDWSQFRTWLETQIESQRC